MLNAHLNMGGMLNEVIYATHMTRLFGFVLQCLVELKHGQWLIPRKSMESTSCRDHGCTKFPHHMLDATHSFHVPGSRHLGARDTSHETSRQCPVYVHTRSTDHGSLVTAMHPSGIAEYAIHGRHQTFS